MPELRGVVEIPGVSYTSLAECLPAGSSDSHRELT